MNDIPIYCEDCQFFEPNVATINAENFRTVKCVHKARCARLWENMINRILDLIKKENQNG